MPFFQHIFATESLSLHDLLTLLLITSSVFVFSEVRKYLQRSKTWRCTFRDRKSSTGKSASGRKPSLYGPTAKDKSYMV